MQSAIREAAAGGSEVATALVQRKAMKVLFEIDGADKAQLMEEAEEELKKREVIHWRDSGSVNATQKFDALSIPVVGETSFQGIRPISTKSRVAMAIPRRIYLERLYVSAEDREALKSDRWLERLRAKGESIDERRRKKISKA